VSNSFVSNSFVSSGFVAQAWMHRGVLLQPSGEDEEEARVPARACLGHGPGAQQALALRDLRN
jgi:hypothetical protein